MTIICELLIQRLLLILKHETVPTGVRNVLRKCAELFTYLQGRVLFRLHLRTDLFFRYLVLQQAVHRHPTELNKCRKFQSSSQNVISNLSADRFFVHEEKPVTDSIQLLTQTYPSVLYIYTNINIICKHLAS